MILALGAAGLLAVLTGVRFALAAAVLRRPEPVYDRDSGPVTILQAVLSGDPTLAGNLRENLANQPDARFVWLIDASDAEGWRIADDLAPTAGGRVEVIGVPPVPQGHNPKVFKLVTGLPRCGDLVAVLDDDTVLPPGALRRAVQALASGDLVTGIPVYRPGHGIWSRLIAAFVNGNALLTYLPPLAYAPPVTINGMFYLTRRSVLESLGGFAAIEDRLCDDHELAKLYRAAGRRIVQTAITHPLSTTVPSFGAYVQLMRRWLVFANRLLGQSLTLPTLGLVVIPSLLPLVAIALSVVFGSPLALAAALGTLLLKAIALAVLRHRVAAAGCPAGDRPADDRPAAIGAEIVAELAADLLLPLHALTTLVRPRRIRWRDKEIDTKGGGVAYRSGSAPDRAPGSAPGCGREWRG
ncbi:MAG: glycosyltransferase [Dactylosporangium sp.]|nr:glycosyltransferase [Dactylosporangium sp.]NNJ62269.1 glycosyltransferase [Dactylosporangium sp.]